MRRPLVLVDVTPLQSEHRFRGVGTYTRHLCEALVRIAPDEVRFVAESRNSDLLPRGVSERAWSARRRHQPAQLYWIPNEWFLRRAIRSEHPSIFHATDFNGFVRPSGVRTVATLYDFTPLKQGLHLGGLSQLLSNLRWWVYYFHKLQQADHIIAISESVSQEAQEFLGISAGRITAIPLGVDLQRFQVPQGRKPIKHRFPYFLFVGGREPHKNFERILAAFALVSSSHPELLLLIAGKWRSRDQEWLQHECARLGVADRVRLRGVVPDEDLPDLYGGAISFLFPSLDEGFGLPVLEAMACGTAVITSDRGALAEVAGDAARLVDPFDTAALAAALAEVSERPMLREDLAKRGVAHAEQFSWLEVARKTIDVYLSTCS